MNLKNDEIIINGGITETKSDQRSFNKSRWCNDCRAIYHSPYFLADIEKDILITKMFQLDQR